MLVREGIASRLSHATSGASAPDVARLPRSLKLDHVEVRAGLLRRLAASRHFALGDRAGVLRAAERRSGRSFRLNLRQRVVVKALVSRHSGSGAARGAALGRHLSYLGRAGAGADGSRADFFDRSDEGLDPRWRTAAWSADRHHFRLIISPEHGDRISDLRGYVREVMRRVSADLGEPHLDWIATCHFDTDQPHAHVLVRGRRADGRDLVIPRAYVSYGIRARAAEVAQERLGDLSRLEAERRVWRETEAGRLTGLDRRLRAAASADGLVEDGVGANGAWAALTRGRLRHLERLGLAERVGRTYRLAPDMEARLMALELRKDVIRTLNQQRLGGAIHVRELGAERVIGRVVRSSFHDELGASRFIVIRDATGVEHYARIGVRGELPRVGAEIVLVPGNGLALVVQAGRGAPDQAL